MMHLRRFPFVWAPALPTPVVGEEPAAPEPEPTWTNITAAAQVWQASAAGLLPRFQHIFPQEPGALQRFAKKPPPT